ncbi:dnaJ homolog subfamily C member 7-like [Babylonia areolata]|uniref:dnaJ homolog subfamily C member 7-like n=1 Tax=Babylonia areolata TaxID=304850 RepID=UPI003FD4BCAB
MSDMEVKETTQMNGMAETPEDDDIEMIEENETEKAETKKEEGNTFYKQQKYREALECYTQAINLCPSCAAYHGNRAATYMMLKKYKEALRDAQQALQLDPSFIKGYIREGKCHLMLGNSMAASKSYNHVLELDPKNSTALTELKNVQGLQDLEDKVELNFVRGDHRTAMFCLDRCLDHSPACVRFKVLKAEALTLLGRHQDSQELANDILQREGMNADAVYVRGLSLYYQDNTEKAFQHFQQVLRLAPDHSKARDALKRAKQLTTEKEAGNAAFRGGRLQEAYDLYNKALQIDPLNKSTNSKLFCNRATVGAKLGKLTEAIDDCCKALELDDGYIKAYLRRAKCYMDTEQYEEAVRDYEKVNKLHKSREHKQLLHEAKVALKRSKRKDYYKILGVVKSASEDEIKKAYKKRALIHHPDRHAHATKEEQKEEERKFKELGEAYSVLSDSKKRARYDNGQDLEDMTDGGGFGDVDPNQIFQAFFGGGMGGGMPGFSFGGGGGAGPGAGGFPGGFSFQFG